MNSYMEIAKMNGYEKKDLNEKDKSFIEGMEYVLSEVLTDRLFGDEKSGADEWSPTMEKMIQEVRDNTVECVKACVESEIAEVMISMLDKEEDDETEDKGSN